jgi:hypothetical protein
MLSRHLLTEGIDQPFTKFLKEYEEHISEFSNLLDVSTAVLSSIKADAERKANVLTRLNEIKTAISEKIKTDRTKAPSQKSWGPKSNINELRKDLRAEVCQHLCDLNTELNLCIDKCDSILLETLSAEEAHLHRRMEFVQSEIEKVQELIQENNKTREKWEELEVDHRASLEAARAVKELLQEGSAVMPIGAFTILRKEIEELGSESQEPWGRLFHNFKELYLCDPGRWDGSTLSRQISGALKELGCATM